MKNVVIAVEVTVPYGLECQRGGLVTSLCPFVEGTAGTYSCRLFGRPLYSYSTQILKCLDCQEAISKVTPE